MTIKSIKKHKLAEWFIGWFNLKPTILPLKRFNRSIRKCFRRKENINSERLNHSKFLLLMLLLLLLAMCLIIGNWESKKEWRVNIWCNVLPIHNEMASLSHHFQWHKFLHFHILLIYNVLQRSIVVTVFDVFFENSVKTKTIEQYWFVNSFSIEP